MFDTKILNHAVMQLSSEGKAEIEKMIKVFEEYKDEVVRLSDICDGYELVAKKLEAENDKLKAQLVVRDA